jgi:hypothetical protein
MAKSSKRDELVTLPDGRKVTWAEYAKTLKEITDEQMQNWQDSQGRPKREK